MQCAQFVPRVAFGFSDDERNRFCCWIYNSVLPDISPVCPFTLYSPLDIWINIFPWVIWMCCTDRGGDAPTCYWSVKLSSVWNRRDWPSNTWVLPSRSTLCSVMAQLTEDIQPSFDTTLKSKAVSENCNVKFTCVVSGGSRVFFYASAWRL